MRGMVLGMCLILCACAAPPVQELDPTPTTDSVQSADGVEIAYETAGNGEPALVFIHGGFADRTFWRHQMEAFQGKHRVVALDLAGHGTSGRNRQHWGVDAFGEDVRAVVEKLDLHRVVVIGNSLGGPVALEAARIMPDRVIGVIGVDTLHDATRIVDEESEEWQGYMEGLRSDFKGTCEVMVRQLFHEDAPADLVEEARTKMCDTDPPPPAAEMVEFFIGYDLGAAMTAAGVPVRSLNGDLYPINMEANTQVADYDAVVMEHAGHYPMLERPEEFDTHLAAMVAELETTVLQTNHGGQQEGGAGQ